MPINHAVDAGGVSWAFTIAEPTVTHTTLVSTDYEVDAGGVSWSFTIAEPTVTKVALVSTDYEVDAGGVSWTFDIPEPTVTHDSPPQMLSDWDDTGLEVEAAARIVASGGETLYADSDRGGTDTPAEGELGLGAGEVPISRIRVLDSGGRINLNDNDNPVALSLATFFGASNTTSEWTAYIQLEDGTLITSDQLAATTGRAANFTISDSDDQAALNAIASGDSFIVAIARATPVAVDYTVDAGGVSWTFAIAQPTVTKVEPVCPRC